MKLDRPISIEIRGNKDLSRAAQQVAFTAGLVWVDGTAVYFNIVNAPHLQLRHVSADPNGPPRLTLDIHQSEHHLVTLDEWTDIIRPSPLAIWFKSHPDYAPDEMPL